MRSRCEWTDLSAGSKWQRRIWMAARRERSRRSCAGVGSGGRSVEELTILSGDVDENTERILGQRTRGQARDASPQHTLSLGPESMKHRVQGIGFRQTVQDLAETILVLDKPGEDGLFNCNPPMDAERAVIPVIPSSSRNEIGKEAGNKCRLIFKPNDVFIVRCRSDHANH